MYKVSVMYPNKEGARFDMDYYRTKHMDIVRECLEPFGLKKSGVERGVSGTGDAPSPYICVGVLYFDDPTGYDKGVAANIDRLRGDIPNFTDVAPTRMVTEVLD